MNATVPEEGLGPLELLVVQPTPFCNLDCSYCYLPDRLSRKRMAPEVLDQVFHRVFTSGLVERTFTVIWHAGEPLVLPPAFYEQALAIIARHNAPGVRVQHSFQTNATLLDESWCAFIKSSGVRVGVSVDGPAFLHDRCRRTRGGRGTHARVMHGVSLLREHGIPFHVITVLTRDSLDYPDELYEFYADHGMEWVGFNVEEVEGPHRRSSLEGDDVGAKYRRFLDRFWDLAATGPRRLWVREFAGALSILAAGADAGPAEGHETRPLAIVNVDCDGRFSTFSPELLGAKCERHGDFIIGRVQTDTFREAARTPRAQSIFAEVAAGVRKCRQTCPYFKLCGGGAPANKFFENGTCDSTETLFCRLGRQAVLDVVLDKLERGAALPPAPACLAGG
jgi:uncharacterized protein